MYPPAYKVKVEDIVLGKYEVSEPAGPSLLTPWGVRIRRARILGTVVDKYIKGDGTYAVLSIDDGSGVIRAKVWQEDVKTVEHIEEGDIVDVIGRIRINEKDGEIFLTPEMVIKITDPNFELLRELEIIEERYRFLKAGMKPLSGEIPLKERVLEIIKNAGKSISIEEISKISMISIDEVEKLVRELLSEGRVVESEIGKFEVV